MKLQIGVMGSAADLNYSTDLEQVAEDIGRLLALDNCVVLYGAEKDYDSLSTAAARGAKKVNGVTIGITYGVNKNLFDKVVTDVCIATGLERGGGREFVLIASCDAIIVISGGSGTLTEVAQAYQLDIPIIVLEGTGGWADKLANTYLDDRKRRKIIGVKTAKEAVDLAIQLALEKLNKEKNNQEDTIK